MCEEGNDILHEILEVPDPEDKEVRIVEKQSATSANLKFSFTIGPKEYPDYNPPSFFPTQEQINMAGKKILDRLKDSTLDISKIDIEAWSDTTFKLKEGKTSEPVSPVSSDELKIIGQKLDNPRITLAFSPQKQEGASTSKEIGISPDTEGREATKKVADNIGQILGIPISIETIFAIEADSDIAVEFDCGVEPSLIIPENVRIYLAESVLHTLESLRIAKESSAEVWIRQGKPATTTIESKQ